MASLDCGLTCSIIKSAIQLLSHHCRDPANRRIIMLFEGSHRDSALTLHATAAAKTANVVLTEQTLTERQLWTDYRRHPRSCRNHVSAALTLEGPLDVSLLDAAVRQLTCAHGALRTSFDTQDGIDVKSCDAQSQYQKLSVLDVTDESLAAALERHIFTPFNLQDGPCWRVSLFHLAPEKHVFSFVAHKIILNSSSLDLLQRHLATLYTSLCKQHDTPLLINTQLPNEMPSQMAEAELPSSSDKSIDWNGLFKDSKAAEIWPDHIRPATLPGTTQKVHTSIEGSTHEYLLSFATEHGTDVGTIILGALEAAHLRLTGEYDTNIAYAGNLSMAEDTTHVGSFNTTRCLRMALENPSFEELLTNINTLLKESSHQSAIDFSQLGSEPQQGSDASHKPLARILFAAHEDDRASSVTFHGLKVSKYEHNTPSSFDLEVHCYEKPQCINIEIRYADVLFREHTMSNLLSTLLKVLNAGLEGPKAPIAELKIFSEQDNLRLQELGMLSEAYDETLPSPSIVEMFKLQALHHASDVAVSDSSRTLTYRELDHGSDRIAQWLFRRNAPAESLIGLFATRSCETIMAMLGILKAGMAYIPLDVRTPPLRLKLIISALSDPKLVVAGSDMLVPEGMSDVANFMSISTILSAKDDPPSTIFTLPKVTGSSLAYVMFTSGSTGKPKGVMIEHGGVVRLGMNGRLNAKLPLTPIMSHLSNLAFDGSTWEIYAALLNGGTLVCMDEATVSDPQQAEKLFRKAKVDTSFFTPALFSQYLQLIPETLSAFKAIMIAGARLDPRDVSKFRQIMTGNLINGYGPTENSGCSTMYCFEPDSKLECPHNVPIGYPISKSGAYVVDSNMNRVPIGVVGELVVTGTGLARGYTDSSRDIGVFVTISIDGWQIRAYRTGDRVRYRPVDGLLEFLGRIDDQVKVRGQRVELGEIESVIASHPRVSNAAVCLEERAGENVLWGFACVDVKRLRADMLSSDADKRRHDNIEHLDMWEEMYDTDAHQQLVNVPRHEIGRDFVGWISMYDQQPIAQHEMDEWLDDTIATICRNGNPKHVLEIGCGSGMILYNLPGELETYLGIDPSRNSVKHVRNSLKSVRPISGTAHVIEGSAMDVAQLPYSFKPDTKVIVNSVTQLFPSQEYLFDFIGTIVEQLEEVSSIFFGDLRSFPLHREFFAAQARTVLGKNANLQLLSKHMKDAEDRELELLVDPAFFTSLIDIFPEQVAHVEIIPKIMEATNELSCFRYGAVIHLRRETRTETLVLRDIPTEQYINFAVQRLSSVSLLDMLRKNETLPEVAFENIPYSKIATERSIVDKVVEVTEGEELPFQDIKEATTKTTTTLQHLSPLDLTNIAKKSGYKVEISWARQHSQHGALDAVFYKPQKELTLPVFFRFPTDHTGRSRETFTNAPWLQRRKHTIRDELYQTMKSRLPSYMIPSSIKVLEKFPITRNGKIDRRALIKLNPASQASSRHQFRPPTSSKERQMQEIWGEILTIDANSIGLDDSFFELGGNSITAMQIVSKAKLAGRIISMASILRQPTLQNVAASTLTAESAVNSIFPFSLLPADIKKSDILEGLSSKYQLNAEAVADVYPCTPLQKGLTFLSLKRVGDYLVQFPMRIPSHFTNDFVQQAWNELVRATPVLRTRIVTYGSDVLQVVLNEQEQISWTQSNSLELYLAKDRHEAIDFGKPLMRLALVDSADDSDRWVVWTIHHSLFDAWSMPLIMDTLDHIIKKNQLLQRAPFQSFVKYVQDINPQEAMGFWSAYLESSDDYSIFPKLPSSLSAPKIDSFLAHKLPKANLSRHGVTSSTMIRAAWALVIGQAAQTKDVVFGSTLSGRNAPVADIELVLGPTFATVPVRVQLDPKQTVKDFLQNVHQQSVRMIPFEQTGLDNIAKQSISCQQACSFQTLLVVQSYQSNDVKYQGSAFIPDWNSYESQQMQYLAPYALQLDIDISTEDLVLKANFDSRVISAGQVTSLLEQMEFAMSYLSADDANRELCQIELLTERHLKQIWEWNRSVPETFDLLLHDMIQQSIDNHPNSPAIHAWDGDFTYSELGNISSHLALGLREMGVVQDAIIPLCFEKSRWTPVAMLAVLNAGGAFVLLDPSVPESRLLQITKQLGSHLILSSASNMPLSSRLAKSAIEISEKTPRLPLRELSASSKIVQSPSTAAFAVFTSGSTGTPKGVVTTHSQFASLVKHQSPTIGYGRATRVFDFASYSFDVAVYNFVASLVNGACLCIPSEEDRTNNISRVMASMRVDMANLTPSVARLLDHRRLPDFKILLMGGEATSKEDEDKWADSRVHVVNGYGPAECVVATVNDGVNSRKNIFSIGRGCGVITWIVDPNNYEILLPPGSVGELLLEGPLLCRGYLNDEDKSAAAFVHDPSWLLNGGPKGFPGRHGRLYKTNDLARYDEDGSLLFIGRKDTQVKIRGQRVELGEIEYHVAKHVSRNSRTAVEVVEVGDVSKKRVLVACIETGPNLPFDQDRTSLGAENFEVSPPTLAKLQDDLPRYMVPDGFLSFEKLPETRTGKIDRKTLRQIVAKHWSEAAVRQMTRSAKQHPATETEHNLSDLWKYILSIEGGDVMIGRNDSFFSLGGNSIDAMRAVAEANKIGLPFSVADVFLYPTLSSLASHIDSTLGKPREDENTIQSLGMIETEQSFAQTRLWFLEQLHTGLGWYTMPFAVRIRGPLQLKCLETALYAVEERHDTLRTIFYSEAGTHKQRVLPFRNRQLRMFDGTGSGDEDDLKRVLRREQNTPFDLTSEPGWRTCLYRLGEHHHVLSIVMHHIISDGWSVDVLRRELSSFYSAAATDGPHMLQAAVPELPIQYTDYSIWQQQETDKGNFENGLQYWLQHLEGSRPAEFLCDKPRPARLSGVAAVKKLEIRSMLYQRLQRFCEKHGLTYFTVLLAAFRAAHYRLTHSRDATIGCPNANRDRWEVKELIGFFVNLQCIRLKISEDSSFKDLVEQVHSVVSQSFEHQDVPFEHIVSKLQHSRDISRNPLAQISFTFNSQKDLGTFQFDGLDVERLDVETKTRFDFEFHLFQETDGLSGSVVYSTELFEPTTVESIISTFLRVLDSGIADADTNIDLLPLVKTGDAPLSYLPHLEFNNPTDYPRDSSIVDVFREQVRDHAPKIAVHDSEYSLSYSQLDQLSDNVATSLQQFNQRQDAIVAMYTVRSCESTVATLGILKAGMAYLPFDISTPALRMEAMLDSLDHVSLVLVGTGLELPPIRNEVQKISIKNMMSYSAKQNGNGNVKREFIAPGPTSLAHVLFTSGSTGKPKGVMIEHRGVVRLSKNSNATHHNPQTDVLAHITSLAFDISTWEIFVTLLNGGTLVCISASDLLDPQRTAQIFQRKNVQAVFMTPRLIEQYLAAQPDIFANFTTVYSGGDFLSSAAVKTIQRYIGTGMINVSGPTENTVISTSYRVPLDCPCVNGVPIGPSMSNTGTYVMDAIQRCVPHGVLGELVVTGDGLARGYVDVEANKTFVSIQIEGRTMRAYRTGDLVRCRPSDRLFEIFGRIDNQIKLRGNRIETSEIEQLMLANDAVNEAGVVLAKADADAEHSILAFIALQNNTTDDLVLDQDDELNQLPTDETDHVTFWGESFDKDTYNNISDFVDTDQLGRDFNGWVSMYDGAKIPETEMNEWLDDTIATIVNGQSGLDVLELGTGTGMMLFSMANHLNSYFGVDPSQTVVDFLNSQISAMPNLHRKVCVRRGTALDLNAFRQTITPNTVVINSVAQYFPSQHYLSQVIQRLIALESVTTIVFGDIRSYALYPQFQATKARRRLGTKGISRYQLQTEMRKTVQSEDELLVDPAFFTSLADTEQLYGVIEHVEILPKRMEAVNELSCYRYAAVLHIRRSNNMPLKVFDVPPRAWVNYAESLRSKIHLKRLLEAHSPSDSFVAVENIPNSNITWENQILACLKNHRDAKHNWKTCTDSMQLGSPESISIMEICEISRQCGYSVEFSSARQSSQAGGVDAVFHKLKNLSAATRTLVKFPVESPTSRSLCHDPLLPERIMKVKSELNERLRARLPAYMIPQNIHVIEKMPLNPNGKLDRAELSLMATSLCGTVEAKRALRQPGSEKEKQMQRMWADILHRNATTISIDDNFFLLGGSSLTAMSLVSKGRSNGTSLSVVDIFKQPTIESLVLAVSYHETSEAPCDSIKPFSLLPMETDIESFVQSIKQEYKIVDDIEDIYPCTPLQEGLLALTDKRPGDYVSQDVIELASDVSITAFKRAWNKVVEAVPVLRTCIVRDSIMGLLQVVLKSQINWVESDSLTSDLKLLEKQHIGLGQPLVRFALANNRSESTKKFIWTIHHSIYDGQSASMILKAFEQAYRGVSFTAGPPFSAFIQHIGQQDRHESSEYWKSMLGNFEGDHFPQKNNQISQPVSDATLCTTFQLSRQDQSGITAANTLRAAWALVTGQVNGSQDVCFGMTVHGRNVPINNIEDMIAPTFATVPVRVKWDRSMRVVNFVNMVQGQAADMMPFEQTGLRNISSISPGCKQACQFQTLIVIQSNTAASPPQDDNAVMKMPKVEDQQRFHFNPYALMLEVTMNKEQVTIYATFDSRLIRTSEVEAVLARLPQTMSQLSAASPEAQISDLDLVSSQDVDKIWNWNEQCPKPIDGPVHELFRAMVRSQPNRPAVEARDGSLTYGELDGLSDSLASTLSENKVFSGSIVPLYFEKSVWTPVAMLAVLKCGAAFTLLEPSLPDSRLRQMVKQTSSQLLLCSVSNMDHAAQFAPTIITVGRDLLKNRTESVDISLSLTSSPELMCVVFTSGSTGQPKGVKLTHSNFISGLHYQAEKLKGFTPESRIFEFASYAFDISIHNAFATLLTGGCLCIPSDGERKSGLTETMARLKVTTANLTTSVARLIAPDQVPDLKVLILAGESVKSEDVARWKSQSAQVVNAYGPAECGISTINSDCSTPERLESIGNGEGLVTWIVDPQSHEKLLGPGCTGELLLEGPLVGAGYLSEAGLASEAFLDTPPSWLVKGHGKIPGRHSRLYKTGDLVRYDEEGRLIFLGRKDSQVKIRGQRTELGEIEAAVHSCFSEASRVAAELVVLPGTNAPSIIAWIEGFGEPRDQFDALIIPAEASMHLERTLPSYMVPSTFIAISELPMTPSGKIDRRRLRELGTEQLLAQKNNEGTKELVEDMITYDDGMVYELAQKVAQLGGSYSPNGTPNGTRPSFANKALHHYGLDSVNLMSLRYHIIKQFRISVGMHLLTDRSTNIRSLAEQIQKHDTGKNVSDDETKGNKALALDLWNEILQYEDKIYRDASVMKSCSTAEQYVQSPSLLVTGGSGYIGTQILRQALESSVYERVITIARGESEQVARERVISAAKKARWWSDKYKSRLMVWRGDLALSQLGLDEPQWKQLIDGQIDTIIHNGAGVHFGKTYADLKDANVTATATLLSIVSANAGMRLLHVTGGQGSAYDDEEEEQLANTLSVDGVIGYSQSKFVAEALVRHTAAKTENHRFAVVSPGLVVGTPEEGIANADDYLWRLAAGCIGIGAYNQDDAQSILKVADVGSVATTILQAASTQHRKPVVEVEGAMTWQYFWTVLQNMGYKLEGKPSSEWLSAMQQDLEQKQQKHPLWPVAHLLQAEDTADNSKPSTDEPSASTQCSDSALERTEAAIQKSAEFLASVGFLPNPTGTIAVMNTETVESQAFTRSGV